MTGFLIWLLCACILLGIGISCFFSEKQVGFWANCSSPKVKDVRKWNCAIGKLLCGYGVFMIICGIPLIFLQEDGASALIFIPMVGLLLGAIAAMIIYTLIIEPKHRED